MTTETGERIQVLPSTWRGQLPLLLVGIEAGGEARRLARLELIRMAMAADAYVRLADSDGLISLDLIDADELRP